MKAVKKINSQSGAAMLTVVVFFLFISLATVFGLVSPVVREYKISRESEESNQSMLLSESVVEDAYYRLKNSLALGSTNTISLNTGSATATITDSGYNEKTITSIGDVNSHERINTLVLTAGVGVSFGYGVQVGQGGFIMDNNSVVEGSVYSNGNITGSGSITGTAAAANAPALFADQTNDSGTPTHDITFGNATATADFAQSFQVSSGQIISEVDLYLKKVSTPGNLTVRIVNDSSGSPGTTTLATGTLLASLVSTTYGWVTVPLSSNPLLSTGVTYWIVIDGSANASKYYMIGANNAGYADGVGKVGAYSGAWSNTSPAGLDGFFKVFLGGATGLISGINIGTSGVGNAYAHTINSSTIAGTKYCQVTNNSPACNTSVSDPTQIAMPISDQNIQDWRDEAEAGGTFSGNKIVNGTSTSLGPLKITGNLTIQNNGDLTMNGTVWVQGNLLVDNNAVVRLASSYGAGSGVMVVEGTITISNNATFMGSGVAGSYVMALSGSSSSSAINLSNNGGSVILYAGNGTVNLANNGTAKSLNGKYIHLNNNAVVVYDSGLANAHFVNGPTGGWGVSTWQETK